MIKQHYSISTECVEDMENVCESNENLSLRNLSWKIPNGKSYIAGIFVSLSKCEQTKPNVSEVAEEAHTEWTAQHSRIEMPHILYRLINNV